MNASAVQPLPPLRDPNSCNGSPGKAVMLQRYMVLHSQQNSVRRRLSSDSSVSRRPLSKTSFSPESSPEMSSSEASSTASSPTLSGRSFSSIPPPAYALPKSATRKTSSRSPSMSPILEDSAMASPNSFNDQASPDETKLYDINADIKSTLTDLLNCEAIRKDHKMRLWVATRLMDAEQELKRQRKRRRSTPTVVLSPSDEVGRKMSV